MPAVPVFRVEIEARPQVGDALADETLRRLQGWLDLRPARVRTRKVYHLDLDIDASEAAAIADALHDPVAERVAVGALPDPEENLCFVSVGFRPGVTDSVGISAKRAAQDRLGRSLVGQVYSSTLYMFWGLDADTVERAAAGALHNPLIERARVETSPRKRDEQGDANLPRAGVDLVPATRVVPLRDADDATLEHLSQAGTLALSLAEMRAIAAHFREQGRDPTDAELECLAQTWSEHCKHKIFNAPIQFVDGKGQIEEIREGLFRRYIRGATSAVDGARQREGKGEFLVSVFHDNAGVVRFTEADHLVYKVETHNSPSALDPYGGAMTGIVGVNRDSFGTGRGADLLTNVWGYCFAAPDYAGVLPKGLMHPKRLRDGVHRGVIDGGNQSGIPYSRGFELFDDRYLGKPLVFCGTAAVMPAVTAGRPTHEKYIEPGDFIVMVGGRIGKDGIHGATFSSVELDETSPVAAVQIGDPITQKMMFDMLSQARDEGLLSGMTDNGAGGLSSSVGELAEQTGGAEIDLALAPLKYPGLAPWEILISEAQERMTLAVPPRHLDAFLALARRREVEATVLGHFTQSGRLIVRYAEQTVVDLSLSFLHEGVPRLPLQARLDETKRPPSELRLPELPHAERLLQLLATPNLRKTSEQARRYDHEVKGLSVIKPLVGVHYDVPSTATVMRARHGRPEGVVLGEGIHPYYSDYDAEAMAQAAVDEAVRRVLCAGARWDRLAALDNFCWPDPVESSKTPDGQHKLAQLVLCCRGLRSACEAYGVPLISGKDSMKNDAHLGGVKISIPPTLLVSVIGQMEDVSRALDLTPRVPGHDVYLLGDTRDELGGSVAAIQAAGGESRPLGGRVPQTDLASFAARYRGFVAVRDRGLLSSAHIVGRGGLAVALAQLVLAGGLAIDCDLEGAHAELSDEALLFSESTGRILFTAAPTHRAALEVLGTHGLRRVGTVGGAVAASDVALSLRRGQRRLLDVEHSRIRAAFDS